MMNLLVTLGSVFVGSRGSRRYSANGSAAFETRSSRPFGSTAYEDMQ